jgi:hypothetical protein
MLFEQVGGSRSYASYAYYHAPVDVADSRLLLEAEWRARLAALKRARAGGSAANLNGIASQNLGLIANAMFAVDVERGLEMLGEVLAMEGNYSDPRIFAISYLIATPTERASLPLAEHLREDSAW